VTPDKPEILFLCVHNAGRSQMAAGFARLRGGDRVTIHSAGTAPGERLNPDVVAAMAEVGIDITAQQPHELTDAMGLRADVIITMGCGDACPVYPGQRYLDWDLPDPAGKSLDEIRPIRDDIEGRVVALLETLLGPSERSDTSTPENPAD
jgi:arsenate reductase